jgi:WD40 repeat protein
MMVPTKFIPTILVMAVCIAAGVFAQDAGAWMVTEMEKPAGLTGDMSSGEIVMSPDGLYLAAVSPGGRSIIIFDLEHNLKKEFMFPDKLQAGIQNLSWSPDGAFLAFTEDFFIKLYEPDIWIFNRKSGGFKNLTDDGIEVTGFSDTTGMLVDILPVWNKKNGKLYFFRSTKVDNPEHPWTLTLMAISPAQDGKPVAVGDLSTVLLPFSFVQPPAVSDDGRFLALVSFRSPGDPSNGVWIVDLQSGKARRIAEAGDLYAGLPDWVKKKPTLYPYDLIWCAGGRGLIIALKNGSNITFQPEACCYLDVNTGRITPLADFSGQKNQGEFYDKGEDGHSPFFKIIRTGILSPDSYTLFFLNFELEPAGNTVMTVSLLHLPPSQPIKPEIVGSIRFKVKRKSPIEKIFFVLSANGRVFLDNYYYLLRFERGAPQGRSK